MTTERRFEMPAGSVTIGVRFRPGMAKPFLRISPAELTDRDVALQDLWGSRAHSLQQQLGDRPSEHVLAAALAAPPAPDPVKRSIELLTQSRGDVELEWLAAQAGLSPRQFRRRCLEESGLSPKQLCRILRFRHACELAAARAQSWAAIAADAGYFDQAHLIHDFQELTGRAPMSVFSNPRAADTVHNRA
jgi:AraC-like DNA-binding protein